MKRSRRTRRAFTLLELMAALVLMATALGIVLFEMDTVSDRGRLRAAASQLGAVYRTAVFDATASGLARVIEFDRKGCTLRKPVYGEGGWRWSTGAHVRVVEGVEIMRAYPMAAPEAQSDYRGVGRIIATPGDRYEKYGIELRLGSGLGVRVVLSGAAGVEDMITEDGA